MDIYLKIITGPRAGDLFKVQKGASVGRSRADINLKDSKASGVHALIEEDAGIFYFADQGSTNGTLVEGARIDRFELKPGLKFIIGATEVEVQTEFQAKSKDTESLSFWREDIYKLLQIAPSSQNPQPLQSFSRALKISVKQGLQEGDSWTVTYGPCSFGALSASQTLLEPKAPDICFEVLEQDGQFYIETAHKDVVLIGKEKKDSEKIYDGIEIQIHNTLLEIHLG